MSPLMLVVPLISAAPAWFGLGFEDARDCVVVAHVDRAGPLRGRPGLVGDCLDELAGQSVRGLSSEDARARMSNAEAGRPFRLKFRKAGVVEVVPQVRTPAVEERFCRQFREESRVVYLFNNETGHRVRFDLPRQRMTLSEFLHWTGTRGRVGVYWPPPCDALAEPWSLELPAALDRELIAGAKVVVFWDAGANEADGGSHAAHQSSRAVPDAGLRPPQ